ESIGKRLRARRQRQRRFERRRHRNREGVLVDHQLDVAVNIRSRGREMQGERRPRLVAADEYAEPIAGVLRIIGTALNRAILLAGKLGRRPGWRIRVSRQSNGHASDEQAWRRESHLTLRESPPAP